MIIDLARLEIWDNLKKHNELWKLSDKKKEEKEKDKISHDVFYPTSSKLYSNSNDINNKN